jgi:hypothetical protein
MRVSLILSVLKFTRTCSYRPIKALATGSLGLRIVRQRHHGFAFFMNSDDSEHSPSGNGCHRPHYATMMLKAIRLLGGNEVKFEPPEHSSAD